MKLACDGHTVTGSRPRAARSRCRSRTMSADPLLHFTDEAEGQPAGGLLEGVEVVRAGPPAPGSATTGGRARPGSRAGPPPSTTSWRRCGSPRAGRSSSTSSSADQSANWPYASSTTTSPGAGVEHRPHRRRVVGQPGRVVGRAEEGDGRLRRRRARRRTRSRSREKSAPALALDHRGPGEVGDVGVQGVGRLERRPTDRPGAAVGQAERLQHLVGAVGAEDLVGPHTVQVGRGRPAAPCAARSG